MSVCERVRVRTQQPLELLLTAHEGCVEPARIWRSVLENLFQTPRVSDGFRLHRVAHEAERFLADEDAARRRILFELRCDTCDSARHVQVLARGRQDMHFAGADSDARREGNVPFLFAQSRLDFDRSANGAQCVVLVQLRHAEDGHHGVADELLDRSTVPGDRFAHEIEVARDQLPVDLGIEIRRQTRRVDEVAEEDRHRSSVGPALHCSRAARPERSVLSQDRLLQRTQLLARLEPELVHQHATRVLVGLERLRLSSGAVERQHQLRTEAFPQGLLSDEVLQLADQLARRPQFELGLDALFERSESRLLQAADLVAGERLECQVLEGGAPPERERGAELLGPLTRFGAACLGGEPLEARQVESLGIDPQYVSGRR